MALPAAVGVGVIEGGAAVAGAAAVATAVSNIEKVFSSSISLKDRLYFLYPQFRFLELFSLLFNSSSSVVGSSSSVTSDFSSSLDTAVQVSIDEGISFARASQEVVSRAQSRVSSIDENIDRNLLSVLESNAKLLDTSFSSGVADLVEQIALSAGILASMLSNINQSIISLNHTLNGLGSVLGSGASFIDVQNVLQSEIYGVLFEQKALLSKIKKDVLEKIQEDLHTIATRFEELEFVVENNPSIHTNVDLSKIEDVADAIRDVFEKTKEKDEAILEDLNYKKSAAVISDLDGNVVANVSPRELEVIKNASVAREKTDINNFELENEDFDIGDLSNITLLDLVKFSQILKDVNNGS